VVVVVGDDAVAATGEHVVLLVRCGNSILVVAVGCSCGGCRVVATEEVTAKVTEDATVGVIVVVAVGRA
jgi:hypothetical protein